MKTHTHTQIRTFLIVYLNKTETYKSGRYYNIDVAAGTLCRPGATADLKSPGFRVKACEID